MLYGKLSLNLNFWNKLNNVKLPLSQSRCIITNGCHGDSDIANTWKGQTYSTLNNVFTLTRTRCACSKNHLKGETDCVKGGTLWMQLYKQDKTILTSGHNGSSKLQMPILSITNHQHVDARALATCQVHLWSILLFHKVSNRMRINIIIIEHMI